MKNILMTNLCECNTSLIKTTITLLKIGTTEITKDAITLLEAQIVLNNRFLNLIKNDS